MRVVVATHNAHKVAELQRILEQQLPGIQLEAYDGPTPVEDGGTFAANALIKARAAAAHTGLPAIADDSGVSVEALGGEPGVDSAHYSGRRDDRANLRLVLKNLADEKHRVAAFTCAAALVDPGEDPVFEHVELGVWPGTIAREEAGVGGFGAVIRRSRCRTSRPRSIGTVGMAPGCDGSHSVWAAKGMTTFRPRLHDFVVMETLQDIHTASVRYRNPLLNRSADTIARLLSALSRRMPGWTVAA